MSAHNPSDVVSKFFRTFTKKNIQLYTFSEDRARILEFMPLVVLEQTDTLELVIQALDYFDKFE